MPEPLPTLDPSLYHLRKVNPAPDDPKEIVYEATSGLPDAGWGLAYADIVESVRHVHHHTREHYAHLAGPTLIVELDGIEHRLDRGGSIDIVPGTAHKARSATSDPVRVVVVTWPQWTPEDHHLLE